MRIHRFATVAVVFLLLAGLGLAAGPARAEGRWQLLGERRVSDKVEHDSIRVTAKEGDFRALQVRVRGVAVQFRSMTVHFANGTSQRVELRDVIRAGEASRVIDLAGGDRVIVRVDFVYDHQALRGRPAVVRLFGRR